MITFKRRNLTDVGKFYKTRAFVFGKTLVQPSLMFSGRAGGFSGGAPTNIKQDLKDKQSSLLSPGKNFVSLATELLKWSPFIQAKTCTIKHF